MSHFGLGLVFELGSGPEPRILSIRDIEWACPACGAEQLRRYWRATPWHSLTLRRFERLVDEAPVGCDETCERCGAPLAPEAAAAWVVHWGFPGGRGLVQAFARADGARRWRLLPHQAMDVQLVLAEEHRDAPGSVEMEQFDERACVHVFGHVFSPKYWIRLALLACARDRIPAADVVARLVGLGAPGASPAGRDGVRLELGAGLTVVLSPRATHAEHVAEVRASLASVHHAAASLLDAGRPTAGFPGASELWLGDLAPLSAEWSVTALASLGRDGEHVRAWAERVAAKFPIRVDFVTDTEGRLRMQTPTAVGDDAPVLELDAIALHAARTASLPPATVHYAMEEAIHFLAGLFGDEFSDAARAVVLTEAPSAAPGEHDA